MGAEVQAALRLPASRRRLLLAAWAVVSALLAARLAWTGLTAQFEDALPFATPIEVDLNTASIPMLMTLPGIGRTRGEAIVLHRVRHGPFRSVDEMVHVDGIGMGTLGRLRPFLRELGK